MKIRDGHVSNSSSSSFMLVCSKKDFDKTLKEVDAYAAIVAYALLEKAGKTKTMGEPIICISYLTGNAAETAYEDEQGPYANLPYPEKQDPDPKKHDYPGKAWQRFVSALPQNRIFMSSFGF